MSNSGMGYLLRSFKSNSASDPGRYGRRRVRGYRDRGYLHERGQSDIFKSIPVKPSAFVPIMVD